MTLVGSVWSVCRESWIAFFSQDIAAHPAVSLLALLKIFRLARMSRIIKRVTMGWTVHTKFIEAVNFFVYVNDDPDHLGLRCNACPCASHGPNHLWLCAL